MDRGARCSWGGRRPFARAGRGTLLDRQVGTCAKPQPVAVLPPKGSGALADHASDDDVRTPLDVRRSKTRTRVGEDAQHRLTVSDRQAQAARIGLYGVDCAVHRSESAFAVLTDFDQLNGSRRWLRTDRAENQRLQLPHLELAVRRRQDADYLD